MDKKSAYFLIENMRIFFILEVNMEAKHSVLIEDRKKVEVKGVKSILGFDEEYLVLELENDTLLLSGKDLRVLDLSREKGSVTVDGLIYELKYTVAKKKRK